ncbi:hypothetical protein BV20DRAFT_107742 [Pilatotrama ljubarskyi]|nr:hypothetical protein BV20DRAFT_107742 [Pilatotrama ljubarskyi]
MIDLGAGERPHFTVREKDQAAGGIPLPGPAGGSTTTLPPLHISARSCSGGTPMRHIAAKLDAIWCPQTAYAVYRKSAKPSAVCGVSPEPVLDGRKSLIEIGRQVQQNEFCGHAPIWKALKFRISSTDRIAVRRLTSTGLPPYSMSPNVGHRADLRRPHPRPLKRRARRCMQAPQLLSDRDEQPLDGRPEATVV